MCVCETFRIFHIEKVAEKLLTRVRSSLVRLYFLYFSTIGIENNNREMVHDRSGAPGAFIVASISVKNLKLASVLCAHSRSGEHSRQAMPTPRCRISDAILSIIRAFIASQPLVIRHSVRFSSAHDSPPWRPSRSFARPRRRVVCRRRWESRGKTKEGKERPSENRPRGGHRRGRHEEKGPQKYETRGKPGRMDYARKRNSCEGGLRERRREQIERERGGRETKERVRTRRRSPWLDIKNVSCGNLTTGRRGDGGRRAVRATSLERRRKGAWKSRSAEREKWRVEGESGRGCCGHGTREFLRLLRACACTSGD